jgi:hypothetical protein
MLRKSGWSPRWFRLPSLLLVLLTTLVLVTSLPAGTDITADRVLGQEVFTLNGANFIDGAGLNFSDGAIGDTSEADGVAIDTKSSPQHLYIADSLNSRVLGWNNAESFTNGQPADLVIGQVDMFHSECNEPAGGFTSAPINALCFPTGVAVDGSGNLYIADYENTRVVEYTAPYAAYAALDQTCTATTPCENELSANLVFGQTVTAGSPPTTSTACNSGAGQNHPATNTGLCGPEGVSVNPTTGDLFVADTLNSRVVVFLNPLAAGGGTPGTSGSAGDTTEDYVFGQTSFTGIDCNQNLSAPTASTLCMSGFFVGGGGVGVDVDGNVYIADTLNNRVLQFDTPLAGNPPPTTVFTANNVFGQAGSFTTSSANLGGSSPTASTLDAPIDVKVDTNFNVYVVDQDNSRVLEFKDGSSRTMPAADTVIGQKNFADNSCQISASCMSDASGVAIDSSGNVFAADLFNNRVLEYDASMLTAENNTASGARSSRVRHGTAQPRRRQGTLDAA